MFFQRLLNYDRLFKIFYCNFIMNVLDILKALRSTSSHFYSYHCGSSNNSSDKIITNFIRILSKFLSNSAIFFFWRLWQEFSPRIYQCFVLNFIVHLFFRDFYFICRVFMTNILELIKELKPSLYLAFTSFRWCLKFKFEKKTFHRILEQSVLFHYLLRFHYFLEK